MSIVLEKVDLVALYFCLLWYHSILNSIDQKYAKTNKICRQNSEIHPAFACSRSPPWFQHRSRQYGACVKRGSGKHMFGLSLFRPSRQSNISTLGKERFKYPLPWENKISQIPYPRANKDNQISTPCPASQTFPPHRRHNIDRCIKRNVEDVSEVKWVTYIYGKIKEDIFYQKITWSICWWPKSSIFDQKFSCCNFPNGHHLTPNWKVNFIQAGPFSFNKL